MSQLTIGQVAGRAGVNVQTIRYYERRGLLAAPARSPSGYRQYPEEAATRVQFIKRAQALGFTLREIEGLLELRVEPGSDCEAVEDQARRAIGRIEETIAELTRMRDALRRLARACRARRPTSECPILDALEGERPAGRRAARHRATPA